MSTPPRPTPDFGMTSFPRMGSPKYRNSVGSSFSFGPGPLVDSLRELTHNNANNANNNANAFTIRTERDTSIALDPNRSIFAASPLHSSPRRGKRRNRKYSNAAAAAAASGSRHHPHPLATDTTDVFQQDGTTTDNDADGDADDEESDYEWGIVDRMRLWRHDALMQHLYDTAAFWGDKIVSWTNDPNDVFWLAQTYYSSHQYSRAERLLTRPFSLSIPSSSKSHGGMPNGTGVGGATAASSFYFKGKGREVDAPFPPRLPAGVGGIIQVPEQLQDGVSRLVDVSVACRYLAARCQVRQGHWQEAMELLGESNPFRGSGNSGPTVPNIDGGIKIEASMCHLRGILMQKTNRGEKAKQCFMEALALDVKCYDAFEQLMSGEMMTPEEEWEFVQSLSYKAQTPDDAEFVQLIYTSRLRKFKHTAEQALTRKRLVEDYGLGDNPDVLFSFADVLYTGFKWADCFVITTRILDLVAVHNPTMPLHIACMYYLSHLHSKLFVLAHEMVDREPENPISWYAVGVWYLAGQKWAQARQYFSKVSLMDPRFAPAWIAFGHTFALEGEHDHAVTAYSTCARMFNGSHLPLMFVGMEQITLSNHALADEALNAAYSMCSGDPLLINERAVMAFYRGDYELAATMFQEAIELAQVTQSSQKTWATTYVNLGNCYRKLRRYEEAKQAYTKVLELDHRNALALGFLGMVHHLMNDIDRAIVRYHEALSIEPVNQSVLELLNLALDSISILRQKEEAAAAGGGTGPESDKLFTMLKSQFNLVQSGAYPNLQHQQQRQLGLGALGSKKGKEKEIPDVPVDAVSPPRDEEMEGSGQGEMMNIG